jgi:hypothetical protein
MAKQPTTTLLDLLLNWWRAQIDIPIHTHCAGCGIRLSRPTHGPSECQSCNASDTRKTQNDIRRQPAMTDDINDDVNNRSMTMPEPSTNIDKFNLSPARHTTIFFRPMSEVVSERLDEQYLRVMEVAGNIEAAKEAWSRSGLVCGVEVGKQTAATEAGKQMHSPLKLAGETLRDIANRIEPPAIWQHGADSMNVVEEVAHV